MEGTPYENDADTMDPGLLCLGEMSGCKKKDSDKRGDYCLVQRSLSRRAGCSLRTSRPDRWNSAAAKAVRWNDWLAYTG